jgi:hypothetical protein
MISATPSESMSIIWTCVIRGRPDAACVDCCWPKGRGLAGNTSPFWGAYIESPGDRRTAVPASAMPRPAAINAKTWVFTRLPPMMLRMPGSVCHSPFYSGSRARLLAPGDEPGWPQPSHQTCRIMASRLSDTSHGLTLHRDHEQSGHGNELVFLRNRVTPSGCRITRNGHRDRLTPHLAAACGWIK